MSKKFVQELADKINEALPEGLKETHAEIDRKIRHGIEDVISNFKFVKQEDFEIQQKILIKTREKLDELVKRVEALEASDATEKKGQKDILDDTK